MIIKRGLIFFVVIAIISGILCGCNASPPSIDTMEQRLRADVDTLQIVIDFLITSEYDSISIDDTSGTMRADFEYVSIQNTDVVGAIKQLLESRNYRCFYKTNNTVDVYMWSNSFDVIAGLAYSINGIDVPDISYVTDLYPLSIDNWYYYISDYNQWRTGKRPDYSVSTDPI